MMAYQWFPNISYSVFCILYWHPIIRMTPIQDKIHICVILTLVWCKDHLTLSSVSSYVSESMRIILEIKIHELFWNLRSRDYLQYCFASAYNILYFWLLGSDRSNSRLSSKIRRNVPGSLLLPISSDATLSTSTCSKF